MEFDLKGILGGHHEGEKVLAKYQNDAEIPVTEQDRNTIINVALGHLIKTLGHYYPQAVTKEKLAISIVETFPQMGLTREGIPSHAYIYNRATGNAYIDQHLKRMRRAALNPDERKRKYANNGPDESSKKKKEKSSKKISFVEPLAQDYVIECIEKVINWS